MFSDRCLLVFSVAQLGIAGPAHSRRALEYLSTRPGLSTVLQGICARHELGASATTASRTRYAAHFTQQQPDGSCWNLTIKTIKDAQKERRNPRNQRAIQPQKMIVSRQSWCRAIQTYEDTLSFGVISKLSNYVVWLSTIKFLHL